MKNRRTLEEILGSKINAEYSEQHAYIMGLVESGRIKPVLASKKMVRSQHCIGNIGSWKKSRIIQI